MSDSLETTKKNAKKPALGRGLGSLLGGMPPGGRQEAVPAASPTPTPQIKTSPEVTFDFAGKVWSLEIDRVIPNPNQPRKEFVKEELESLANSISSQGILQPITVRRRADGRFEIIAGERRWRAAQLAKLSVIPAIVKEVDDKKSLELALIENIQRQDLNPIEEAEAYQYLMKEHQMTQQELADQVGKERATVANVLRLLQLDKEVRDWVSQGSITMAQAKVLLSITDLKLMKALAKKTKDQKLTVRALEKLARTTNSEIEAQASIDESTEAKLAIKSLQDRLQKTLGTKVELLYNESGTGKLTVHFQTQEQLDKIVQKMGI
jgi:ParB family chromosome partitioning protein